MKKRLLALCLLVVLVLGSIGTPNILAAQPTSEQTFPAAIRDVFPDPLLAMQVALLLEKEVSDMVTSTELARFQPEWSQANFTNISNLQGIQYLTSLTSLSISNQYTRLASLTPLANLTNLNSLNLFGDININDFSPLTYLTGLHNVSIFVTRSHEPIAIDFQPFAELPNLFGLFLDFDITDEPFAFAPIDFSPIGDMANLTGLSITGIPIENLGQLATALERLPNLTFLSIRSDIITDISPLARLTNLDNLRLMDSLITDISPLAGMVNLRFLSLSNSWNNTRPHQITDFTPLGNLTNLESMDLPRGLSNEEIDQITRVTNFVWYQPWHTWRLTRVATPSTHNILLDGQLVNLTAFNIGGSNFFRLRDVAYLLNGTAAQFEVTWDARNQIIRLIPGQPYTPIGTEMSAETIRETRAAQGTVSLMIEEQWIGSWAYNIDGYNYFMLRSLGGYLDFRVGWD
ncbi:MAG: hypothetical protein FWC93_07000, partial [Defluviitaleaceae bacterium]|nr:hypothetical protein [Defluviitaleaceae bacterium]